MAEIENHTLAWMRKIDGKLDATRAELLTELRAVRDDRTVMIRMLQRREAEIDAMRALEQRYESVRAELRRLPDQIDELKTTTPRS